MAEASHHSQFPSKIKVSIYTLPQGSPPAVRVEVTTGKIISSRLLKVFFDTVGLQERSRPFFGLFKGLDPQIRKIGDDETIYVPCRYVISVRKWSFDPVREAKAIRTDVPSLRLLALEINADIVAGRLQPTSEEKEKLEEMLDPGFPSYKQFVEYARGIKGYGDVVTKDVALIKSINLKTQVIKKGSKIDIACSDKKMVIITDKKELHIPWRKVRQWTQIGGQNSIGFEIYLMEERAFTWIEMQTNQASYLLQVTSELVARLNERLKQSEFKKPKWAQNSPAGKRLSWKLFKKEVFGIGDSPELEPHFDNLEDEASSSEDEEKDLKFVNRAQCKSKSSTAYLVKEDK